MRFGDPGLGDILFAPDGRTLLVAYLACDKLKTLIESFNVLTGQRRTAAADGEFFIHNVEVGPDGTTLAAIVSQLDAKRDEDGLFTITGDRGRPKLALWDLPKLTQRALVDIPGKGAAKTDAAQMPLVFSRNGKNLLTGMTLWDVAKGRPLRTLASTEFAEALCWKDANPVCGSLALRPDGFTAVVGAGMDSLEGIWICDFRKGSMKSICDKDSDGPQGGAVCAAARWPSGRTPFVGATATFFGALARVRSWPS